MTALESVEGDDSLNAVMYLLALVIKRFSTQCSPFNSETLVTLIFYLLGVWMI